MAASWPRVDLRIAAPLRVNAWICAVHSANYGPQFGAAGTDAPHAFFPKRLSRIAYERQPPPVDFRGRNFSPAGR
jgi:hypothetical protein